VEACVEGPNAALVVAWRVTSPADDVALPVEPMPPQYAES